MISIKYNGQFLYLPPSSSVRTKLFSSIFYDDQGGYSLPFNLPIENNSFYLDSNDLINISGKVNRKFEVEVFLFGNSWQKGILRIKNVEHPNFVCNLNLDAAVLANDIVNKKLSDLNYDEAPMRSDYPYLKISLTGGSTASLMTLNINGMGKTIPYNFSLAQTMADFAAAYMADTSARAANQIGSVVADANVIKIYSTNVSLIPQMQPTGVPGGSDPGPGRTFTAFDSLNCGDIIDHMEEVAQGTYPNYNYTFFPLKNPNFYGDANPNYNEYLNYFSNSKFAGNAVNGGGLMDYSICPFPYMFFILQECFNESNLLMKGNVLNDEDLKRIVLYNNYALDNLVRDGSGQSFANKWSTKINFKNHVPDISVGDYIKAVKNNFFFAFFYDISNNQVQIKSLNEILSSPEYEDWTSIASPKFNEETNESDGFILQPKNDDDDEGFSEMVLDISGLNVKEPVQSISNLPYTGNEIGDIRLVKDQNYYYKASQVLMTGTSTYTWRWDFYSENLIKYKVGNGNETIPLQAGTTATKYIKDAVAPDKNWVIPYANQQGSSPEYGLGVNPFSLRFIIYRGFQAGKETDYSDITYPMATPYEYDYNGNEIGDLSLAIEGDNGIYNKLARKWLEFKSNTRPIKINLPDLTEEIIRNLDFSLKKRIDGVDYLLADIDVTYVNNKVTSAAGLFYKV